MSNNTFWVFSKLTKNVMIKYNLPHLSCKMFVSMKCLYEKLLYIIKNIAS